MDLLNNLFIEHIVSKSRKGVFLVLNFKLNFCPFLMQFWDF